jgi:CBS domain containing-hemolysin-like protein/mannitol/fructose-specific phosphotransferase system IIA component
VRVRATRVEELARRGHVRAAIVRGLVRQLDAYLSAIQFGITVCSLGLGWVGEPAFAKLLEGVFGLVGFWSTVSAYTLSFVAAFLLITFLQIVIGELSPRFIAINNPLKTALVVAAPIRFFSFLVYPLLKVLHKSSLLVVRLLRVKRASEAEMAHSEEELRMILSASQKSGVISLRHLAFMENVFEFTDKIASQIMVPREKIAFLDVNKPWAENLRTIVATRFTRYPICEGTLDRPLGIAHVKELTGFLGYPDRGPNLKQVRRGVVVAPPDTPLESLLAQFQQRHLQLALLTDHKGRVAGLVTLEDVLEELVGEIRDEFYREKETRIGALLRREAVVLELPDQDRAGAINTLVRRLAAFHPEVKPESAIASVIQREDSMPTGIGNNVAIPHARIENLKGVALALGRSSAGIDFRSPDQSPARLIFLILSPIHDEGAQVRTLAQIARIVSKAETRQALLESQTVEEVCERIRQTEAAF